MKKEFIAGIDVSKLSLSITILFKGDIIDQYDITNDLNGYKKLLKKYSKEELLICLDDCGNYHARFIKYLTDQSYQFHLASGLRIKRSMGLQRGKSDQIDSLVIAKYAYKEELSFTDRYNGLYHELKLLRRHREGLVKQQSILKRNLKEYEILNGVVDIKLNESSCQRLNKVLIVELKKVEEKIIELIEGDSSLRKQYDLLLSVRGIGKQLAVGMIIYTEGFNKFSSWRKFSCYAGLAPFPHQSGTSVKGRTRVSPIAHKELKPILTICAVNMLRYSNEYRRFYDRKKAEGKHHMVIINSLRNKIVSRAFSVVKRQTPYVALDF